MYKFHGFSLLEVLLSLGIFSFVSISVISYDIHLVKLLKEQQSVFIALIQKENQQQSKVLQQHKDYY